MLITTAWFTEHVEVYLGPCLGYWLTQVFISSGVNKVQISVIKHIIGSEQHLCKVIQWVNYIWDLDQKSSWQSQQALLFSSLRFCTWGRGTAVVQVALEKHSLNIKPSYLLSELLVSEQCTKNKLVNSIIHWTTIKLIYLFVCFQLVTPNLNFSVESQE